MVETWSEQATATLSASDKALYLGVSIGDIDEPLDRCSCGHIADGRHPGDVAKHWSIDCSSIKYKNRNCSAHWTCIPFLLNIFFVQNTITSRRFDLPICTPQFLSLYLSSPSRPWQPLLISKPAKVLLPWAVQLRRR